MNDQLLKLTEQNGQWIRRRVSLGKTDTEVKLAGGSSLAMPCYSPHGLWSDFFSATPSWELTEHKISESWAVGKFRYYRPEFDVLNANYHSSMSSIMRYLTLFGLRVTPSNIYKATPWTWAIDWFTNIGKQIERFSDMYVDSMAAQYLYSMLHERTERRITCRLPFWSGMLTLVFTRIIETKQREEASSPYGFSLTWDQLTPRQLAISAALGISRYKKP